MNKDKLLKEIQEYSNVAFLQGYEAAKRNIPKDKANELNEMPEAWPRISCAVKIYNMIKGTDLKM